MIHGCGPFGLALEFEFTILPRLHSSFGFNFKSDWGAGLFLFVLAPSR